MKITGWITGIALISITSSCGMLDGTGRGLQRLELEAARDRWAAARVEDYSFRVERFCFCALLGVLTIEVRDGAAVSASRETGEAVELSPGLTPSVNDLFDLIERGLDEEWHRLDVVYDEDVGYPREIQIDRRANTADDESSYTAQLVDGFLVDVDSDVLMTPSFDTLEMPDDDATIRGVTLEDDELTLAVQFGGGCRRHDFVLYQSSNFSDGPDVSLRLSLSHDGHGDACERAVSADLIFNLAPVAAAFRDRFGPGPGVVMIGILPPGQSEPLDPPLAYSF